MVGLSVVSAGFSLLELLIAMALSLLMVLSATTIFITCRSIYLTQDDSVRVSDNGRFAIETIGRAVAQAGFADPGGVHRTAALTIAPIAGLDNRSLKSTSPAIQSPVAQTVNGSDVLALHFNGSGNGDGGDGLVTNCAGFSVGRSDSDDMYTDRGWSIFYIAKDHTGEPELYCKYRGKNAWATAAIARGVESFQVLYGVGEGNDAVPTRFLSATQIDSLDRGLSLTDASARARSQGIQHHSIWKKISQIKVALLLRGSLPIRSDALAQRWDMFGAGYAGDESDPGVHLDETDFAPSTRNRLRKLFRADFRVRNVALESMP